jgi:hypothetical protein
MIVQVGGDNVNQNGYQAAINLGVGPAGSEKIICNTLLFNGLAGSSGQYMSQIYAFPCAIPAKTRISAQAYSINTTDTCDVSVLLFDGAFTQSEGNGGVDCYGQSGAIGTLLTAGAAATKGSYTALTAATTRDYCGFFFSGDPAGGSYVYDAFLLDIAIGAAGSERIILPDYRIGFQSAGSSCTGYCGYPSPFVPVQVPAGTRISARIAAINASDTFHVSWYGVYQ